MIVNRRHKISVLFFILMLALSAALEWKLYRTGEDFLMKNAEEIFQSAVIKEFDNRFRELELPFHCRLSKPISQLNNCIITNAKGKSVIDIDHDREKKLVGTSFQKKMEHTILARENFIAIDSLSFLWNEKLQEAGIVSKNAIRINLKSPKDTMHLTSGDTTLYIPKYKITDTFYTGLSNEIEIEAFIHYSWATVMRHSSLGLIVISLFVLCSILFFSFILFFRQKAPNIHLHTPVVPDSSDGEMLVLGNISYKSHLFYVDGKEIRVRPQIASLLLFLLRKPNYFATKSEIIILLWGTDNIGADVRLRRAISDLRSLLKEKSVNVELSAEEDGFRLIIQNKPFHRENRTIRRVVSVFSRSFSQLSHNFCSAFHFRIHIFAPSN